MWRREIGVQAETHGVSVNWANGLCSLKEHPEWHTPTGLYSLFSNHSFSNFIKPYLTDKGFVESICPLVFLLEHDLFHPNLPKCFKPLALTGKLNWITNELKSLGKVLFDKKGPQLPLKLFFVFWFCFGSPLILTLRTFKLVAFLGVIWSFWS